LFRAVEDEDGEEEGDQEEDGAVEETGGIEGADTQATVFEALENGGKRVDVQQETVLWGGEAQGVDDGGGVHQQLDAETYEEREVTVLGGPGGDDETPGHGVKTNHDDEHRGQQER